MCRVPVNQEGTGSASRWGKICSCGQHGQVRGQGSESNEGSRGTAVGNRVLAVLHKLRDGSKAWTIQCHVPGGKMEQSDESLHAAGVRELKEEVGTANRRC